MHYLQSCENIDKNGKLVYNQDPMTPPLPILSVQFDTNLLTSINTIQYSLEMNHHHCVLDPQLFTTVQVWLIIVVQRVFVPIANSLIL